MLDAKEGARNESKVAMARVGSGKWVDRESGGEVTQRPALPSRTDRLIYHRGVYIARPTITPR